MSQGSNSNAPSSDKTSTNAPATPLGESSFLAQQAADAKAAISRVVGDLKQELTHAADPRAWMQVHPWTTMGAAAVAGFVAAAAAIPSREEQALKRLAAVEKALNPRGRDDLDPAVANGDGVRKAQAASKGSFLSGLAGQILHAVQPVLMSAITAGVTAKTVKEEAPTGGSPPTGYETPAATQDRPSSDPSI